VDSCSVKGNENSMAYMSHFLISVHRRVNFYLKNKSGKSLKLCFFMKVAIYTVLV